MARKKNDIPQESSQKHFLTIVIPVRNEERFIEKTIDQILSQDYPKNRYEVIVVDGESTDHTREIVQSISSKYSNIKIVNNPRRRSSSGRNVGFKHGSGDYFLVIDGHCYIDNKQLLKNLVMCFEKSNADCLGRPQPLDPPDLTRFQSIVCNARASSIGHGSDSLIYSRYEGYASPVSNGASYRKEVFKIVGYVDENFDACEDVEFNFRLEKAGMKAYTSPDLRVRYYPRENLGSLYRQMVRYGAGRFQLFVKHRESLTLNALIPFFFTLTTLLTPAAIIITILSLSSLTGYWSLGDSNLLNLPAWVLLFPSLGILISDTAYMGLVALYSYRLSKSLKAGGFATYIFVFFTIHFGLGFGFLSGIIKSFLSKLKIRRFLCG